MLCCFGVINNNNNNYRDVRFPFPYHPFKEKKPILEVSGQQKSIVTFCCRVYAANGSSESDLGTGRIAVWANFDGGKL